MSDRPMTTDEQRRLWDAINHYATTCGADPSAHVYGNIARQLAVVEIERVVRDACSPSRFKVCPDCHGQMRLPCSACDRGHVDCERCEGTDQEDCPRCGADGVVRRKVAP